MHKFVQDFNSEQLKLWNFPLVGFMNFIWYFIRIFQPTERNVLLSSGLALMEMKTLFYLELTCALYDSNQLWHWCSSFLKNKINDNRTILDKDGYVSTFRYRYLWSITFHQFHNFSFSFYERVFHLQNYLWSSSYRQHTLDIRIWKPRERGRRGGRYRKNCFQSWYGGVSDVIRGAKFGLSSDFSVCFCLFVSLHPHVNHS